MTNTSGNMWNLPNMLTMVRIVIVPIFLGALLSADGTSVGWRLIATTLFVLAMVTDKLDGDIARKRGLVTNFGKIADPIADKALMSAALLGLWAIDVLPLWIPLVILVREFGITVMRLVILRFMVLPASRGGKLKTVTQTVAIGLLLLQAVVVEFVTQPWSTMYLVITWVLLGIAVIITVVTGIHYVWMVIRDFRTRLQAPRKSALK